MKQINYTGPSKLISRIVYLLNRKAPLPLDGNGDPDWGTNGQVLMTDGSGSTSWGAGGGGGDTVTWTQDQLSGTKIAEIDINGTSTNVYAPTPTAQVQADWTEADNTAVDYIKNKPNLATVATSGSYTDLTDKPTIPSVGGHTIEKSDGTDMTQRANLEFVGSYLADDAGNDRTIANIVRTMTQAQFDLLSAAEKEGFIYISDAAGQLTASEVALAAIAGMSATTAQSGIAELQSDKVEKSGDTMTGPLTIQNVSDAILIKRSNSSTYSGWIGFYNSGGFLGYYGVNANKKPVFFDTSEHLLCMRTVTTLVNESVTIAASGNKTYAALTASALNDYDEIHFLGIFSNVYVNGSATKAQISKVAADANNGRLYFNPPFSISGTINVTYSFSVRADSNGLKVVNDSKSSSITGLLIEGIKYN